MGVASPHKLSKQMSGVTLLEQKDEVYVSKFILSFAQNLDRIVRDNIKAELKDE